MNDLQRKIALAITILSGAVILRSWIKKWLQGPPKIIKLLIYPIKSIPGFEVDHLDIVDTGVEWNGVHDRSMVLINAKNIIITQRNQPKLSMIRLKIEDKFLILDAPEMETFKIPYFDENLMTKEMISFEIWGQMTEGYVCRQEFSDWFSKFLQIDCKLIRIGPNIKHRNPKVLGNLLTETNVTYQDMFPIMLINQSSIDDLNKRLNGKMIVDHRNFRPNLVIANADAYEEDEWKKLLINNVEYYMPKPCDRCVMTTIDHNRFAKNPDNEPLKTLRTYRIDKYWNEKAPLFGINLIAKENGKICFNNQIQVI